MSLRIANFLLDLAGRTYSFQKIVAGGVAVNEVLAMPGLMADNYLVPAGRLRKTRLPRWPRQERPRETSFS